MSKNFKSPPEAARQFPRVVLDDPILRFGHPKVDDDDDEEGDDDEELDRRVRGLSSVINPFVSISADLYKSDYNNRIIVINEKIDARCFVYAKMIENWNRQDRKASELKELAKKAVKNDPDTGIFFGCKGFDYGNLKDETEIAAKAEEKATELLGKHPELVSLFSDLKSLNIARMDILNWKPVPIKIKFNSPGGWLVAYQTLSDVITLSKTKVIGINMGMAYSAAAFLLISCHERLALPKSRILVHRGSGGNFGSYEQTESSQQNYKEQVDEMILAFRKRTKISTKVLKKNMNPDWYLSAKMALQYGMIDRIITDINEIIWK